MKKEWEELKKKLQVTERINFKKILWTLILLSERVTCFDFKKLMCE